MRAGPGLAVLGVVWRLAAYPAYVVSLALAWVFHPHGHPVRLPLVVVVLVIVSRLV